MSRQDSRQIGDVKVMLVKGDSGSSVESIEKTGTQGAVDTYTITMTDGLKFTFTVTNGATITNIEKTDTQGLVDTYTITMSDGSTSTFTVTNGADGEDGADGNGIVSIEKTSTQGAVDTYTITMSDGSTATFTVTNATGVIDDALSTSSENAVQNKVITNKINGIDEKIVAMDDNVADTEDDATASRTYVKGEYLIRNNILYKVTTAIASGGTFIVGTNIEQTTIGAELKGGGGMPTLNYTTPLHTFRANQLNYTATKTCYLLGSIKHQTNNSYNTGVTINGHLIFNNSVYSSGSSTVGESIVPLIKISSGDSVSVNSEQSNLFIFDTID